MNDRNRSRAFEEYSAKALGLTDLRVGFHEVREKSGAMSTTIYVDSIWTLRIIPFREQRGFITVASSGTENGETVWRRAVMRTAGTEIVRDLSADPVAAILSIVDLMANPTSASKDGISYELIVRTPTTLATIQFSNPRTEPWRSLELSALQLAAKLVENCESEPLVEFVATWRRYCERPR